MSKDDVLAAFGGPQKGPPFVDLIDADPPPRELTPIMKRYIRRKPRTGWAIVVWFFLIGAVGAAAIVPQASTIAWAVGLVGITGFMQWRVMQRRAAIKKVVIHGTQEAARVAEVHTTQYRSGLIPVGARVQLVLNVGGTGYHHDSFDGSLNDLSQGSWIRVLVHPDCPGVLVPVLSVS